MDRADSHLLAIVRKMWASRELIGGRSVNDVVDAVRRRLPRRPRAGSAQPAADHPVDGTGLDLRGAVPVTVNPYEQELAGFGADYALSFDEVRAALPTVTVERRDFERSAYLTFLDETLPRHGDIAKRVEHKKKLEMFITHSLVHTGPDVVFLDAAGAGFSYIDTVVARRRFLQDIVIRSRIRERFGDVVEYIESSLDVIPLPDGSIDSISCHHAFEHFQGEVDIRFIREVQRVLAPAGRACIVPVFLSTDYVEMTCRKRFKNWSGGDRAVRVVDPTATLPGRGSGGFARIYDVEAFTARVLDNIDLARFDVALIECTLDGGPIPNPAAYARHKVSNFNFPYRALTITRRPD